MLFFSDYQHLGFSLTVKAAENRVIFVLHDEIIGGSRKFNHFLMTALRRLKDKGTDTRVYLKGSTVSSPSDSLVLLFIVYAFLKNTQIMILYLINSGLVINLVWVFMEDFI